MILCKVKIIRYITYLLNHFGGEIVKMKLIKILFLDSITMERKKTISEASIEPKEEVNVRIL